MKPVIDEPNENGMYSPIRVISDLEMGILCEMGYLIDSPNIQCDECFTINNSENGPFEFINLISLVDMDCCKSCFYTCISQPLTVLKTDLLCNDIPGGESIELIDVWTDLNIEIIFDPNNPDEIVIIGAEGFIEEGEIFYTILGCEGDMHSASFFVTIDYCPPCENEPCDNLLCEDDFEVPSNLQIFGDPAEGDIWRMSWFGHPFITEQQASAVGNRNTPLIDKFNGDDFLRIGGFNRSTVAFKLTEPINNCSIEFTFDGSASIPNGVLEIRGSEFPPCHRCTEIPIGDNCDQVTDCGDYEFSPACIGQVDIDIDEPVVCDVILEDLILEPQSLIVDVNADFDINYIQLSAQNGCLYIDNIRLTKYIYPDFEFEIDCSMADFNSLDECLANSHIWDFGDPASGANNTSTLQNPIHTYEMNGTYVVTHTIIDECNTSTSSQEIVIDCEPLNCDETPDGYISLINESTSNSLLFPGSQSTGVDYFVEGVLTINKSYTFLNCNFLMGEGAEIIIDPGFVLNSENCVYEACDKMWNGIDLFNQSVLNSNGDIFMDANRAIEGIYKFPLVSLNGSNFRGNYVGVYDGPNAATTFTQFVDVEMYGTRLDGSIAEPYDGMIGVDGINTVPENLSRGRNGVWISHNNSAIIGNPDLPSNYFENLDHAFEFHRSTVTLLHNSINSCSTGIFAEHSDLTANGISVNQALIENCNLGISTIRSDIEIINYHITDCPQSIRVEQSPNEISINDNLIERSTNNIEVSLSDLAQMQINQNQIIAPFNVGQPAFGIRIIEQNDRVENNNMHTSIISDNTISADYGISSFSAINLVNADNHLIVSNCIIDPRWTAMDIFNSNSNIVSCNSISGIGNGMRISQSINGRYKCNIVDLSGSAVRFFGTCTGTDFAGNNLTGYTALSISGITGHQIHKGNTFETIGIHEVANFASSFVLLQASTFFYDDNLNSEFLPDSHWFPNLPTAALDDWFKFDPDLSNETYYCQTPIVDCTNAPCLDQALISPDVITSIDLGNANGSIRFEDIYVGENRNLEDALYLKLDRLPELVFEDQLIEGFYNTTSTSSIGAFRELEKSVSNSLMLSPENKSKLATYRLNKKQAIDDLQIILDNLPADPNPAQWNLIRTEVATANGLIEKWAGYEQELKDVTNIIRNEALGEALIENNNISEEHSLDNFEKVVVDAYISIKMSADNEYILDTGVSNELAYIANQCPSIYGKVVHKARGLMYLINPEMMFDDDVLCQQPYNFQSSNPDNEKNALEFNNRYSVQNNKLENVKLQPNPTNSKLEITGNLEQCIFYLFDIHGKLLINENVNSDMHSIDVSSLSPGIYHCKLINESGETVFVEKVIVAR